MSKEPENIIEEKIRLECSNCGQETYVTGRVAEMWEFYNKHKTRIGNSYCHKDHLHLHVIEHNKSIQSKERERMRERVEDWCTLSPKYRTKETLLKQLKD